ncbi:Predicted homoserine dehydrogenase, contains C-terminal SAF domain [Thermanaeromonas toyohensis ToBE]|uniref:Predicted homoserine dehydrogenase, contains C-terminal SAF domain n=1 Tax=Thermanaeromonas toyohensis ToBE TaxID=698762 RepID=A0A1W1VPR6_9FIRM|nr:NAD(P)-dependent oxidoreductase [Thermanaeromonas toyohensis]SMB95071.1 Predicted homoserine dehydrogenase, contains C-terminal SAF domain [Thermanaeromonas toyohensis ToBE]
MLNINYKLAQLEEEGRFIKVGLVGAGQMGTGMVNQISLMKGMEVVIIADLDLERARQAYIYRGEDPGRIIKADTREEALKALEQGRPAITDNARLICELDPIDVVVDATGVPQVGAEIAFLAIQNGKHVVTLNVEADVTVGRILSRLAQRAGVVYTLGAGDEPACIKELYDFAEALGFKVIACGKGKNNPLDYYCTPESLIEIARVKGANPKMLTSFYDGTKTMVEMAAVANATGLLPDVPGMHGPQATVEELPRIFELKERGGILNSLGVVDFVIGVAPGVFAIVTTDNLKVREELAYLQMGEGPNYVLYRPYHLTSLETPLSIARAVIYGEPTLVPRFHAAEVAAVAKKKLLPGEILDGIGGTTVYGLIVKAEEAESQGYLPMGLTGCKCVVKRPVERGEVLRWSDISLEEENALVQLYRLQKIM